MSDPTHSDSSSFLLGQIDAKVSHLLAAFLVQKQDIKEATTELHNRIDGHGSRLQHLETTYWKSIGILSLIPIVLTLTGLTIAFLNMR